MDESHVQCVCISKYIYTEWQKLDSSEYISYDSNYVKFKKRQNSSIVLEIQESIYLGEEKKLS